ncbi:uncharacterized protein TNCV_3136921 [Trichonephila clavipes]|nr:uncharacterized protein TNCV_3136921 [Trichonephila clavipes]
MSETGLIEHIMARLESQVQDYVEGSSKNYNSERRDRDVRRRSPIDHKNRNWSDVEVLDRQNDRIVNYRNKPGLSQVLYHEIDTGDKTPMVSRPYWYDRVKQGTIDYHVEKMLKEGTIIPIQSPYASPVVLCRKNKGLPPENLDAYSFAVYYHKPNAITNLVISKEGITTDESKVSAIVEIKPPKNSRDVEMSRYDLAWYRVRTRDKASHGPIPIPLGYRSPKERGANGFSVLPEEYFSGSENVNESLEGIDSQLRLLEIPRDLSCAYLKGHLLGRAQVWYQIFGSALVQNTATDCAQFTAALSKAFPTIRNKKDLEKVLCIPTEKGVQELTDFVCNLLNLHKKLELGMSD